jgi:hypothetical protein
MKAEYLAVFSLGAFNRIADAEQAILATVPKSAAILTIAHDIDSICLDLDRSDAMAERFFTMLGIASEGASLSFAEHVALMAEKRRKKFPRGVFLVVQATTEVDRPDLSNMRESDGIAIAIDAFEKEPVRKALLPIIESALAAIQTVVSDTSDPTVTKVGERVYLIKEDGSPIYSLNVQMGAANAYVVPRLSAENLALAQSRFAKLLGNAPLSRVASLLADSVQAGTNPLQSFVSVWAALEIFIDTQFKASYRERWFKTVAANVPESSVAYVARLKAVMTDKDRLLDKFIVITSLLSLSSATADVGTFKAIKSARDGLFHQAGAQNQAFPTTEAQTLLRKYLGLHLDAAV